MGNFQNMLDDWSKTGRALDVTTLTPVLQRFESGEQRIYENLDTESVNPFPMDDLMESLLIGPNSTAAEILRTVCSFCYRTQRLGPPRVNIDAADFRYYRPGGKTNPLSPPPNGLDEVVHGAVYGRDLADRIESTG